MMITLALVFFAMLLILGAMSIGILAGRSPIKGSCGGLSAKNGQGECSICGHRDNNCER